MQIFDRVVLGFISLVVSLLVPSIFVSFGGLTRTPGWAGSFWNMHDPVSIVAIALIAFVFYVSARLFSWAFQFDVESQIWRRAYQTTFTVIAFVIQGFAHMSMRVFTTQISVGTSGKNAASAVEALTSSPAFVWECVIVALMLCTVARVHPVIAKWMTDHDLISISSASKPALIS